MNRQQLAQALDAFIADKVLQVAALSGDWGVGKTYFWRHEYAKKLDLGEAFNGHCYASLFGADSLDETRGRIAAGMKLAKSRKAIAERYTKQVRELLIPRQLPGKSIGMLELFDKWHKGELASLASEASYWFVRDAIVCLDDIERKGSALDPVALFGLVDELRERDCKVVMLLNRSQLAYEDDAVKRYWEKVVDIDLSLAPDIATNVAIVCNEVKLPPLVQDAATDLFSKVGCRNMRIQGRAAGVLAAIADELKTVSDQAKQYIARHSALLAWALLNPSQTFDTNMIIGSGEAKMWFALIDQAENDERVSEIEREWARVLEQTGYRPAAFDEHLIRYIQTGYLDRLVFAAALAEFDNQLTYANLEDQLNQTVFSYQNDFTMTREEYIDRVSVALREGMDGLTVFQFDQGLQALIRAGQNVTALCGDYIRARGEHLQAVAEADERDRQPETQLLSDEIHRRHADYLGRRYTIDQVADSLRGGDGWTRSQVEFLAAQPAAHYVTWIQSNPPDLGYKMRAIHRLGGGNAGPEFEAASRLEEALRQLADQSEFNAERVRTLFGIDTRANGGEPDT